MIILRLITAILLSGFVQQPQQMADPDFNSKIEKPAYVDKHPSVLFDEAHNNFHTSGGRYKPFADLITSDGYAIRPGIAPFTDKTLAGHDVLIIANAGAEDADAKSPFTDDECETLRKWISDGGSLLLIADHAPFGAAAQKLGKTLGVEMDAAFTTDSKNCEAGNSSWLIFSTGNGLLTPHAITKGRSSDEALKKVVTFTGQSLKGPAGSVAFLKLGDTAEDRADQKAPTKSAAGRAQGIAFKLGKGRVVVMGEAACLTAQVIKQGDKVLRKTGMNHAGSDNRQLALNIMHWLSGLTD